MPGQSTGIAILGAGLAGLSLACALLEEGVDVPITLIDRRRAWGSDRTWCTWQTTPMGFTELADAQWSRWTVRAGTASATGHSARYPYIHLDSAAVYRAALTRLRHAPHVELRHPVMVHGLKERRAGVRVLTSEGALDAGLVFDALGPHSPLLPSRREPDVALAQTFVGWEVETETAAFDPATATLMDFRPCADGLRFLYVLPFSAHRALVEDTSVARGTVPVGARREALRAELAARLGASPYRLIREERGLVPMTLADFPLRRGERTWAVGAAGGAIRPSSGYAFSRTQQHVSAVARAIAQGAPLPERIGAERTRVLDTIFLHALDAEPARFPAIFARMVQSVPGEIFARFMTDVSSPADDARLIAALPKAPFLAAALRSGQAHAARWVLPDRMPAEAPAAMSRTRGGAR
jgi:lycopene beta-cyclase